MMLFSYRLSFLCRLFLAVASWVAFNFIQKGRSFYLSIFEIWRNRLSIVIHSLHFLFFVKLIYSICLHHLIVDVIEYIPRESKTIIGKEVIYVLTNRRTCITNCMTHYLKSDHKYDEKENNLNNNLTKKVSL